MRSSHSHSIHVHYQNCYGCNSLHCNGFYCFNAWNSSSGMNHHPICPSQYLDTKLDQIINLLKEKESEK